MVIDCHMHYIPEAFPLERMLAGMESTGIEKTALIAPPVEPFSVDAWLKRASNDLLRFGLMRFNPIGRFFYNALLVDKKGYAHILWDKYRIIDKPDNSLVAEAIDKHPDKFMGWIFINPAVDKDPISEIEKWSSNPRMVGVKAHPFYHRYAVELLDSAAGWCRERGYPLLIHLGSSGGSGDYERLPEKYPGLKVLYAHAGIPYYRKLWTYIKDKEDLFIDLSSPYVNQKIMRMAVDFLGAEKCLYGTDGPFGEQPKGADYDYGWIKGRIKALPLSDRELEKIFSENFEAIRKR